ncbi:MAG: hypothetical protein Q9195_006945 [Heterodermia aff. obscurata]
MAPVVLSSVDTFTRILKDLLRKAGQVRSEGEIVQPLEKQQFGDRIDHIGRAAGTALVPTLQAQYAAIETASRNILYDLIATTSITEAAFGQVWNLLDIITLVSDADQCEAGLAFWLVEELLDTQTIDGCRIVFDYLESRRERMCANRLSKKDLIILRACNELLRRLSRAEDTVFCGRVFIYMFQSFPLGDKSSVNLRGEYHSENVTAFDEPVAIPEQPESGLMDVDSKMGNTDSEHIEPGQPAKSILETTEATSIETTQPETLIKTDDQPSQTGNTEDDPNHFYAEFWALQRNFAMPTRLFEDENFRELKRSMSSTIRKFQTVNQGLQARSPSVAVEEHSAKRKREDYEQDLSDSFNPKYLTSRDLFDLEISDLAFRRHILVQALILIDFLLSLTPKAKKKLAGKANKSVLYAYVLSDEDTQWATQMRSDIATYLQQGPEGKFYYRMVDTVLSRDKNWTHWKAESCPKIQRPPVSAQDFVDARKGAQKACATKRLKANPLGSLNLGFLSEGSGDGLKKLSDSERYSVPSVESFKESIAEDSLDIEMAKNDEEKQLLRDARASKIWRTLRIASKNKFKLFDKIEDGSDLGVLFEPGVDESQGTMEGVDAGAPEEDPASIGSEQVVSSDSLLEIRP